MLFFMTDKNDDEEIFTSLVRSGFEFLHKALDEFEQSPKFSTIHFATAIEIFLKARLLKDHWTLVLENTDKANRQSFEKGEARTVNTDTATRRLQNICGVSIPEYATKSFKEIASHRNRMIHFYHSGAENNDDIERQKIVQEQCRGWFALQQLLFAWKEFSEEDFWEIRQIADKMKQHRAFLSAKFEGLSDKLQARRENGYVIQKCKSCSFLAAALSKKSDMLLDGNCLVCDQNIISLTLECSNYDCEGEISLNPFCDDLPSCENCEEPLTQEDVRCRSSNVI